MKVSRIAVHQKPHLDELFAVWILRNYGEAKFPEISAAKLVVWGEGEATKISPEMATMSGTLLVGIGGGVFDEHRQGCEGECASTLVAKHLGVDKHPLLKRLLYDVMEADSNIDGSLHCLAEEIKNLNRYWVGSLELERLYFQFEPHIIARVERQKEYSRAKEHFKDCYRNRVGGVAIVADPDCNPQFQQVARSRGARVIVQRNSAGLTQIFGDKGLDMPGLAIRVRKLEIRRSGVRPPRFLNDEELSRVGTLEGIPQWYLDDNDFLLNGSESFEDVPPSSIEFKELVYLVEKHLADVARVSHADKKDEPVMAG